MPTGPLRELGMCNFSTVLARLNAKIVQTRGNTHVATLQIWRDDGREAEWIHMMTRGPGEPRATTASEPAYALVKGGPSIHLVLREILNGKVLEALDWDRYKRHQKLMIGEQTPANAWYLCAVLRCLGIDARVMHSGSSNKARGDMVRLFNKPKSTFKCLIMMFDMGGTGLNVHHANDRVVITSIARSR
ncbi:hypothetical protein D6D05_02150 [Aureobasidium pullulans]|nr:hypothetical protein JADG_001415 [Aureobasidium pullulans]THX87333.1 hypothetical protein D6D05_02150 [Aureobasidium pullulans]THZ10650.1 hypothetical protein D6C95_00401 [Aureobasidium pullulans]TIA23890.1 hypothetical protein D6C80_00364 [Aureobasidium pullulans]